MASYAAQTTTSVESSRSEIERTLKRYGATAFAYATSSKDARIAFEDNNRRIRFTLPLPDRSEFTKTPTKGLLRSPEAIDAAWEQACRQRWRALALILKAKLEAIAAGIVEFEDEFMSNIVLPDGSTVGENIRPEIARTYLENRMVQLLGGPQK